MFDRLNELPKKKRQAGNALIQVLIATGLLSMVALIYAQMSSEGIKNQANTRNLFEMNNLSSLVSSVMAKNSICNFNIPSGLSPKTFDKTTISSMTPAVLNMQNLKFLNGSKITEINANISNGMKLTSIKISVFQEIDPNLEYLANLELVSTRTNGVFIGGAEVIRSIPITLKTKLNSGTTVEVVGCGVGASGGSGNLKLFTGKGCAACPYGSYVLTPGVGGAASRVKIDACKIKLEDGSWYNNNAPAAVAAHDGSVAFMNWINGLGKSGVQSICHIFADNLSGSSYNMNDDIEFIFPSY